MVTWENYWKRFVDVFIQFDLAKKAISGFRDTPEAVRKFAENETESLRISVKEYLEKKGADFQDTWLYDETKFEKYVENTIETIPNRLPDIENRINQNHLILCVTLFETFMKEIHREILHQNPQLLNPDRKIPLGRVISAGLDRVIEEEIEREVHNLDRKSIEERCEYFKDRLSIDWSFDGTVIPLIKSIIDQRNAILHIDPDINIEEFDLHIALSICMGISMITIVQAHILHPKAFKAPDHSKNISRHFANKLKRINSRTSG